MIMPNNEEEVRIKQIMGWAFSEALSNHMSRSYREIWVDMLGKITSIRYPKIAAVFMNMAPELQNEIGERSEYPFSQFINDVARIENSVANALTLCGEKPALN